MASNEIVEAIHDLTRVMIALNGKFESKADAVRALHALAIPPVRIASILAMELKAVHSYLSRLKAKTRDASAPGQEAFSE